jgi:hypothetical protein
MPLEKHSCNTVPLVTLGVFASVDNFLISKLTTASSIYFDKSYELAKTKPRLGKMTSQHTVSGGLAKSICRPKVKRLQQSDVFGRRKMPLETKTCLDLKMANEHRLLEF